MKTHEAKAFVQLTHELLVKAANSSGDLSDEDEKQLLDLEEEAIELLSGDLSEFRIITSERSTAVNRANLPITDDPQDLRFNRHQNVTAIELMPQEKTLKYGGKTHELSFNVYTASGGEGRDYAATRSGPEGFIDGKPFGAASALVARLLEARASGLV